MLLLLSACQMAPLKEEDKVPAFGLELGKSFEQLKNVYDLREPAPGFNEGRNLSPLRNSYKFEDLPFEVVFVFDKPGSQGYLRAVENICRQIDADEAPTRLARLLDALTRLWGQAAEADETARLWRWQLPEFSATLSAPQVQSGVSWALSLEQNTGIRPAQSTQIMGTLAGWDQALFGSTLESLQSVYVLGQLGRSRLNDKPASMVQNEVSYLGHPFKAAFFFDRFTDQANLVGIDLYLLEDQDPDTWLQKRQEMIKTLTKLYGQPATRKEGHRYLWTFTDPKGSLTFTDASKGNRTTWLLAFRPAPGKIDPPPALAAPRTPQDIAGWANVRFGMSPAQVELLYTGQSPGFQRLAGSGYGFEKELAFENMDFKVLFLFDRKVRPARLMQVVLSRRAPDSLDDAQRMEQRNDLMNLLTAWYGTPTQDHLSAKGGGKAIWSRPSGYLEFHDLPEIKTWVLNYRDHH